MTPADELKAAAAKLRTLAESASTDADGVPTANWTAGSLGPDGDSHWTLYGDHLTRDDGRVIAWPPLLHGGSMRSPAHMHGHHARYTAAMDPAVGLLLAKWLASWDGADISEHAAMPDDLAHALAIARAINAGSQP